MPRSVATIERELEQNREQSIALSRTRRRLEDELKEAKLAHANANPHPWLGKKLKRGPFTTGYRNKLTTQRGVLKVKQDREYFRGCSASTGDLIVVTSSGLTAYHFATREGDAPWELDQ